MTEQQARETIEALRSALHCAVCYWGIYYLDLNGCGDPLLAKKPGEEGDDYRHCLELLDHEEGESG